MSTIVLPAPLVGFLEGMQWVFFAYFLCINLAYLLLNYVSVFGVIRYMREHGAQYLLKNFSSYQPPVTVIVPAYNEERTIVSSIQSLLRLNYPEFDLCAPTPQDTYDVVICEQVLEHVIDPFDAARNLRALCKPGGHVVVTTPFLIKVHELPMFGMRD